MYEDNFLKIIYLLENIDKSLREQNKDKFLENFYDGLIIGITSGVISGFIIMLFTYLLSK